MVKEIPIEDVKVVKYENERCNVLAVIGKLIAIEDWEEDSSSGIHWLQQDDWYLEYPVEVDGVQTFIEYGDD